MQMTFEIEILGNDEKSDYYASEILLLLNAEVGEESGTTIFWIVQSKGNSTKCNPVV